MFDLPSILTDAQVATFAATIALLVGIIQQLSWFPIPDGSKARAWAVSVLSAMFVGLSAPTAGLAGTDLVMAIVFSFAALASASLGINRAGSFTARKIAESTTTGDDGSDPTLNTRGDAP